MSHIFSCRRISFFFCMLAVTVFSVCMLLQPCTAKAGPISFIILNRYSVSMKIGDTCRLLAVSSDNSIPKFKSSKSSVASVNTYGRITAKSAGTAVITAKTKNAAASCRITVNKTQITLNQNSVRLERNGQFHLKAFTSNGSKVTFKTNKKSVAAVSDEGVITGQKPGEAKITVTADRTSVVCLVTVQKPSVHLDQTYLSLYRCGRRRILATVSSGIRPVWKSSRSSVAEVNEFGVVTAKKHGSAKITAAVDGVKKTCYVTVKSPTIRLDRTSVSMKTGQKTQLKADVSSHIKPVWRVSNSKVISVDENGVVTACKKGTAYVTASEDGTSARCKITVTDR